MKTIGSLFLFAGVIAIAQAVSHKPVAKHFLKSHADHRIIEGSPAVNGQFPHQAFLIITVSDQSRYACGGSLISDIWILTAASYLIRVSSIQVHLGHVNYASSPVIQTTNTFVRHEHFNPSNFHNDIGLVRLNTAVQQTNNIKVIPFARDPTITFAGMSATVSGFGSIVDGGAVSPTLNFVGVRILSNIECQPYFPPGLVIPSTMCIVGGTTIAQGICDGDNGGPLTANVNGVPILIGIISFAANIGCSTAYPNGLVRPSHFVNWINRHTGL